MANHAKAAPQRKRVGHRDEVFAEIPLGVQKGFLAVASADDKLILKGRCPRCRGDMQFPIAKGVPYGSGLDSVLGRAEKIDVEVVPETVATVYCACGFPHKDRPADSTETGCGAYWDVDFS
jgi:hypothetical protein